MKPHADFECLNCAGEDDIAPVRHDDLPVDCKFCPACGSNKGFTKIFTANVMGSHTRTVSKVLDEQLRPMYEKDAKTKAGAESFARAAQEATEKQYEKATPAERAHLPTTFQPHVAPAGAVLGGMSKEARNDTRECVTPALLNRKVSPQWQR